MIKVNHPKKEHGMADFGKNSQKNKLDHGSRSDPDMKAITSWNVATAEYSYFSIHQIKAWPVWSVNQAEISYTIDSPCYLNAERSADV